MSSRITVALVEDMRDGSINMFAYGEEIRPVDGINDPMTEDDIAFAVAAHWNVPVDEVHIIQFRSVMDSKVDDSIDEFLAEN